MKLATWNVNSLKVRLPHLVDWLAAAQPDVICLQETKLEDGKFPQAEIEATGFQAAWSGQKTYNGVALLARSAPRDIVTAIPGFADEQKRVVAATVGDLRVVCLYAPNGQAIDSDKYAYKLRWYAALRGWLADELACHPRLAVLGDLNVAPEDRDVHDPKAWRDRCSAGTRAGRRFRPCALGLEDAYAFSSSPKNRSPGGTTGCWDFVAMPGCASTTSCCQRRSPRSARPARSTRRRARSSARPTTPRSSPNFARRNPRRVRRVQRFIPFCTPGRAAMRLPQRFRLSMPPAASSID